MNIATLLNAKNEIEIKIRNEAENIISNHPLLEDSKFWNMIELLNKELLSRKNNVKEGAHNFFCHYRENLSDCISFVKTYGDKVARIHRDDNVYESLTPFTYLSDDGWYDFTDMLPLYGKKAYAEVLEGNAHQNSDYLADSREIYMLSTLKEKIVIFLDDLYEDESDEEFDILNKTKNDLHEEKIKNRHLMKTIGKIKSELEDLTTRFRA